MKKVVSGVRVDYYEYVVPVVRTRAQGFVRDCVGVVRFRDIFVVFFLDRRRTSYCDVEYVAHRRYSCRPRARHVFFHGRKLVDDRAHLVFGPAACRVREACEEIQRVPSFVFVRACRKHVIVFRAKKKSVADTKTDMSQFGQYSARNTGETPYFSSMFSSKPDPALPTGSIHRLFVDARDRYDSANSSPFNFRVYLDNAHRDNHTGVSAYENVTSIEMKGLAIPKISNEPYVIVDIDECNDNVLDATNNPANGAFAIAYYDADTLSVGSVKPIKGIDYYQKKITFNPPIPRLDRLSIKFKKHDGNVITTSDTANGDHVSILFEITTSRQRRGWMTTM